MNTTNCPLCDSSSHEDVRACPKLSIAKDLLMERDSRVEVILDQDKPGIDQTKPPDVDIAYETPYPATNQLVLKNELHLVEKQFRALLSTEQGEQEIFLWSGQPGICWRGPLIFSNSVSFKIAYGDAMISKPGGPGNYQKIPHHRGPVIRVTETDSNNETTTVYIDVDNLSATIGIGWITDFRPSQ